jgi:hypothetical protein
MLSLLSIVMARGSAPTAGGAGNGPCLLCDGSGEEPHLDSFSIKHCAPVPEPIRKTVEQHVASHLPAEILAKLHDLHARGLPISHDGAFFHFGGGLAVRNLCRERLSDDELAARGGLGADWDNCYVGGSHRKAAIAASASRRAIAICPLVATVTSRCARRGATVPSRCRTTVTTVTSRRDKRYKEKLRGESSQRRATSHGTPPPHDDRIATVSLPYRYRIGDTTRVR